MCGSVDDKSAIGRPHREWLDDIADWYRMNYTSYVEVLQTRTTWRQIVSRVWEIKGQ